MPQKYFICPDGEKTEIVNCLKDCRMCNRCMTKPSLIFLSLSRKWTGKPSVTQLLKGTLEAALEITKDWSESPDDGAFKMLGTSVHAALDKADGDFLTEADTGRLSVDGITGLPDLLEYENGEYILTDYKTSGSYKVKKAMGIVFELVDSKLATYAKKTTITGPNGEKIIREKGQPKLIKIWKSDLTKQDCKDWVYQLNYYRILLEEANFEVGKMRIQAIVRDGGLQVATSRGVSRKIMLIPIPFIDDIKVKQYFHNKRDALLLAVNTMIADENWIPPKCTEEETWDGAKCERFCNVREFCPYMNGGKDVS